MGAMALHSFAFGSMTAGELVAVLNEEASLIEACAVERKLVGLIED